MRTPESGDREMEVDDALDEGKRLDCEAFRVFMQAGLESFKAFSARHGAPTRMESKFSADLHPME